jgi:putative tricarboxylic transport membrane protein
MDSFNLLLDGFGTALTPENLLFALIGVVLGTAVGVLPGIGPATTVALLLPVTFALPATSSLIMFAGIYYGGMYGGSTTSILLNTPGEAASIVTALEGNKMAKAGRGAAALATAAIGSFVAGTIATILLTFLAPVVVQLAIQLSPADYVALMVLAFITVSAVLGSSVVRGLASLTVGLMIGLIGIDAQTGQPRFTFGIPQLLDGIDVVVVAVALFAVGEALWVASPLRHTPADLIPIRGRWFTRQDFGRSWKPWLRGTALGFPFGTLPAGGAEVPTFLSYAAEKRLSKHKEEFGKGAIEGVAGPEAANNAAAAGVLVPLLTLGLPTSSTAAVMLVAFRQYGIQPGPELFNQNGALVWALIASLYVGNVMLLILNLPLAGVWVKLLRIPRPYLYAGILMFGALGSYTINLSPVDLALLFALGAMGFLFRRYGWPVAPAIIGVILGPIAEQQLRRALAISQGDAAVLVESPFSMILLSFSALLLIVPLVVRLTGQRGSAEEPLPETAGTCTDATSTATEGPDAAAASGATAQPAVPASRGTLDDQPKDQP